MKFSSSIQSFLDLCFRFMALSVMTISLFGQESAPAQTNCGNVPQAIKFYEKGDINKALEILNEALKACPDNTTALYYLGLVHKQNGYVGGMRDAFTRLVRLQNETRAEVYADLAYAYVFKDGKSALVYANRALELGVQPSVDFYWAVAESKRGAGTFEDAIRNANLAIAKDKNYTHAYITKYLALRSLTKLSEAATVLEAMLQLPGQELSVWKDELAYFRQFGTPVSAPNTSSITANYPTYTAKEVSKKSVILAKPAPRYTEPARKAVLTGTTQLRILLGADGLVKSTHIVTWLPLGLTDEAVAAARRIKFSPALKDGAPVSQWIQIQYDFNLY